MREVSPEEKVTPFEAVRLCSQGIEVLLRGSWEQLRRLGDIEVADLVAFAQATYGERWLKRLSEDLPRVFADFGKRLVTPIPAVLGNDKATTSTMLSCTEEKRVSSLVYNRSQLEELRRPASNEGDTLRALLLARYSYWQLVDDPDWVMEPVTDALSDEVSPGEFELAVYKSLARMGDGHTRTRRSRAALLIDSTKRAGLTPSFLPFRLLPVEQNRFVAIDQQGELVESQYPYVSELDGVPISRWAVAVGDVVPIVSDHFRILITADVLSHVTWARGCLDLPNHNYVDAQFIDSNGDGPIKRFETIEKPISRFETLRSRSILKGNVGYLPISSARPGAAEQALTDFEALKSTEGLVIDLRNNRGGVRELIRQLTPHFLDPDGPDVVFNIAAKRLFSGESRNDAGLLDDRHVFPHGSDHHTSAGRAAIERTMRSFLPTWSPPAEDFSEWHFGTLSPTLTTWHYGRKVALLTNESTFSAAEILTTSLRCCPLVIHVGTTTGGGSGRPLPYTLPSSNVRVQMSSMVSYRPDGQLYERAGVVPDHVVPRRASDIAEKFDSALETARRLVIE